MPCMGPRFASIAFQIPAAQKLQAIVCPLLASSTYSLLQKAEKYSCQPFKQACLIDHGPVTAARLYRRTGCLLREPSGQSKQLTVM